MKNGERERRFLRNVSDIRLKNFSRFQPKPLIPFKWSKAQISTLLVGYVSSLYNFHCSISEIRCFVWINDFFKSRIKNWIMKSRVIWLFIHFPLCKSLKIDADLVPVDAVNSSFSEMREDEIFFHWIRLVLNWLSWTNWTSKHLYSSGSLIPNIECKTLSKCVSSERGFSAFLCGWTSVFPHSFLSINSLDRFCTLSIFVEAICERFPAPCRWGEKEQRSPNSLRRYLLNGQGEFLSYG